MDTVNLTHHFLIAMPNMVDPNFNGTLTYICEHSDQGALGVVVNRPIDLDLSTLFEQIGLSLPERLHSDIGVFRRPGADRARLCAAHPAADLQLHAHGQATRSA